MLSLWQKYILLVGVHNNLPADEKSRIKIVNRIAFFISLLTLVYVVVNRFTDARNPLVQHFSSTDIVNIGAMTLIFPMLTLNYFGFYKLARYLMLLFLFILFLSNALTIGKPYRTELYFLPLAAMAFVIIKDRWVLIFFFLLCLVGYALVAKQVLELNSSLDVVSPTLFIRLLIAFTMLFFIIYFLKLEANRYQDEIEVKNSQLMLEKEEMEKINFTKDKIFSIISHDLRSPIASLKSLLTLLNDDTIGKEDFKKATLGLEKQVHQLSSSLDELLTWSKAQLHGINPMPEEVKLREAVMQVVNVLKLSARDKGIIITTNLDPYLAVWCDPNMLHSVLTNLISNAIKFTPIGGAISIASTEEQAWVTFRVEDTGLGIKAENIARILNPTELFTTRGTNNEKGTGLGLAMCAEFIQKNKGELRIESEDGKGSRFIVKLPTASADASLS